MANAGVPICLVSTPQFITAQKVMEKTGWNSAQLTGRIGHYEFLPTELTLADLTDVGRAVLPEASTDVLAALASYARVSARYLAAVDSIAKRAQFIAQRNGRKQCTAGDVRTAMQESVIPSDTMLVRTLEHAKKSGDNGRTLAAVTPPQPETESPAVARRTQPAKAVQTAFSRRADPVELVQP
jgi:histone H3/H4